MYRERARRGELTREKTNNYHRECSKTFGGYILNKKQSGAAS